MKPEHRKQVEAWVRSMLGEIQAATEGLTAEGVDRTLAQRVAARAANADRETIERIMREELAPIFAILDRRDAEARAAGAELDAERARLDAEMARLDDELRRLDEDEAAESGGNNA